MTHEVIRHLLDDYVTGELTEDARGPVADHIAACAICGAEVESLKGILARAADLPRSIDPPPEAWLNIRAAIERDKEAVATHHETSEKFLATAVRAGGRGGSGRGPLLRWNCALSQFAKAQTRIPRALPRAMPRSGATPATFVAFTIEENNYLRNVAVLQDLTRSAGSVAGPGNRRTAQGEPPHDRRSDSRSAKRARSRPGEQDADRDAVGNLSTEDGSDAPDGGDDAWELSFA